MRAASDESDREVRARATPVSRPERQRDDERRERNPRKSGMAELREAGGEQQAGEQG
jgi:hypothetical protein